MDVYVFPDQCEMFCERCAARSVKRDKLTPAEKRATLDAALVTGDQSADTPQHCADCGKFLENPLTKDGDEYVRERVRAAVAAGRLKSVAVTEWAPFYNITAQETP